MLGVAACSGSPPDLELGTAADPQVATYAIAGVRTSPGTVHFTGLPWLLDSAEGTGPLVVTTNVGTFVMPAMSTTVTGVDPDKVSQAVGYSLFERHDVIAVSTATLTDYETSRLEAYASFVETSWAVADASSGALLGAGASFNPSGVFFQTVPADHVPLPDMGLITFVPGCEGLACTLPPGPGGEVDAGAAESQAPGFLPSLLNPLLGGVGVIGAEGASPSPPRH
jgi:hypothetical protein